MNALSKSFCALLTALLASPLLALPQPQLLDGFQRAGADGRPSGWDVVAFGAEASISHVAEDPQSMRLQYRFTARDGVIYLLCRSRLRAKPWSVEVTVKGDGGGQVLGVLLRESVEGEIFEYRASPPLTETGWATRSIEPKQPAARGGVGNGKLDMLKGGGGIRLAALVVRRGPGTKEQGELLVSEVLALCDVTRQQATMIDIVCDRYDRIYQTGDRPEIDLLASSVSDGDAQIDVSYTVQDATGQNCGRGQKRVKVLSGETARIPVTFQPRGEHGHYKITAAARAGGNERHATARFCVVPPVPDGAGRGLGCHVLPHTDAAEEWLDVVLFRMLRRAGAAGARFDLRWSEVEKSRGQRQWKVLDHFIACSKQTGLPLYVVVSDPPGWLRRGGAAFDAQALARLVAEGARRGGDTIAGWEIWRQPNTPRYWPPEPQPYAYRALVEACRSSLQGGAQKPLVVNGGLRGLERGFAGTLLTAEPPIDRLGLAARVPRYAFPMPAGSDPPSSEIETMLRGAREWMQTTGRDYMPPWLVDVGVRTSPIQESKLGQAVELARCASLARSFGGMMFWHRARDGSERTDRYGLIRRNLEPKPALAAMVAVAAATHGARPLGIPESPAGQHLFVLDTDHGPTAIGWNDRGSRTVRIDGPSTILDMWGNKTSGSSARIGGTPVYLTGAGVAKLLP